MLLLSRASAQQPPPPKPDPSQKDFQVQLEPPGPDRIFRLESEAALRQRIMQEFRNRNERAEFPRDADLVRPGESQQARYFPPTASFFVPDAVCYNPLYFEEKNTERYGWDAGVFQPFLSTANFYKDLVCLPYNMGSMHPYACEFNTGYYKPGDAVPLFTYVPAFSVKGALMQAGTVVGGIAIFP
jgi:hypothetical protein